jgi:hypothetical protein
MYEPVPPLPIGTLVAMVPTVVPLFNRLIVTVDPHVPE